MVGEDGEHDHTGREERPMSRLEREAQPLGWSVQGREQNMPAVPPEGGRGNLEVRSALLGKICASAVCPMSEYQHLPALGIISVAMNFPIPYSLSYINCQNNGVTLDHIHPLLPHLSVTS